MTTSTLFAAIALTVATTSAAFAQQATYDYPQAATSQKSRAEVRAQTLAAIASGDLTELNRSNHNGFEGVTFKAPAATRMAGK